MDRSAFATGIVASCAALALVVAAAATCAGAAEAASLREPVLKQVDLPHSYYWRELYLPQLTTGPASASFLPDGKTLVVSQAGSLWRQALGSQEAVELTHPRGAYDYQPDVSRDGRRVVFTRYDGRSMALWRLDLASGKADALTTDGSVNVEPRWSPDGKRLAWISAQASGRFRLFIADVDATGLHGARALLEDRKSEIDRYYYSAFDHQVNPSWSPDGKSLLFVANPETAWGTGGVYSVGVDSLGSPARVLSEETSWSAPARACAGG